MSEPQYLELCEKYSEFELFAALLLALAAPKPHNQSPAYAVKYAYDETIMIDESRLSWMPRFLAMSGREYNVSWCGDSAEWVRSNEFPIRGMTIAEDCVYWMRRQWDFNFHDCDDRWESKKRKENKKLATGKQMSPFYANEFLLPQYGEIVRRAWTCVANGKVRMLDIWQSPQEGSYYYVIREKGSPEILARCWYPYLAADLKALVETELLPAAASKPFLVKSRRYQQALQTTAKG